MANGGEYAILLTKKTPVFIKKLETQSAYEGSRFEFICEVQSHENVLISWMKDGKSDLPDRYHVCSEGSVQRLRCDRAEMSDAGRFVCVARNEFGEKRSMNLLTIQKGFDQSSSRSRGPSKLTEFSKEIFVTDKKVTERVQNPDGHSSTGKQPPSTKPTNYTTTDFPQHPASSNVRSKVFSFSSIEFSVAPSQKPTANHGVRVKKIRDHSIAIEDNTKQIEATSDESERLTENGFYRSEEKHLSDEVIQGKKQNEEEAAQATDQIQCEEEQQQEQMRLKELNAETSDKEEERQSEGQIVQEERQSKDYETEKEIEDDNDDDEKIKFEEMQQENKIKYEGRPIQVEMDSSKEGNRTDILHSEDGRASPAPRDDANGNGGGGGGLFPSRHKLELCTKSSDPGPTNPSPCRAPEVRHLHPEDVHVVRGADVLLSASFDPSLVELKVRWFKGTNELVPDDRIHIETSLSSSTVRITDSHPRDSNCYTIDVGNEFGSDQLSSSVTVEDRPDPPLQEPAVTRVTECSLVLSWYGPPFDGASPLVGYKVERLQLADDGGGDLVSDWSAVSEDCQHTTYLVGGLKPATPYKFRISCRNKHGFSEPGIPTEVVTTLAARDGIDDDDDIKSAEDNNNNNREETITIELSSENEDGNNNNNIVVVVDPSRKFQEHYRLGEVIGRGRFGVVQECFQLSTGLKFAAKVIKLKQNASSSSSSVVDFRREVEVMNRLRHPKLLRLWDAFESRREAHLVMEFIGGRELLERITTDDYTLTEGDCIDYVRQICSGIQHMHTHGVLHLDVKLDNILCLSSAGTTADEPRNDIRIIDFGLSRVYDPTSELKVMFGTPEFVAPEVVNYDPISPASDMWSVGVVTYILLSGFSPFAGNSDPETLSNVTKAAYDYDEGFDGVSEAARAFIDSLLARDPKKRMTSEECLRHDWLSCEERSGLARRLSTSQHKRFLNRRRWQKTGNAFRALSRLKGELNLQMQQQQQQQPRGMSIDRKTHFSKVLSRRDSSLLDAVFGSSPPNDDLQLSRQRRRFGSLGSIVERRRSRSHEESSSLKVSTQHLVTTRVEPSHR